MRRNGDGKLWNGDAGDAGVAGVAGVGSQGGAGRGGEGRPAYTRRGGSGGVPLCRKGGVGGRGSGDCVRPRAVYFHRGGRDLHGW